MTTPLLELPRSLREELKAPMGSIYTDADTLASDAGEPLVTVGDIVTYHLLTAGHRPDVALVDDRTERSAVDPDVSAAITGFDRRIAVENPPGTLTAALLEAIVDAVAAADESTVISVDGEEDLGALAAILAVPSGGSVVYGQPGEGMVLVDVSEAADGVRDLVGRMDGDSESALGTLEG